jgi:uncharacterized protein (TIGR02145 family)
MNKILTFISAVVLTASLWAQAPNKMSFQTVVRNNLGKLVVNKSIGVRLSILKTSSTGTAVYVETHSKTSNVNGLLTLEVGTGTVTSGTFTTINWSQGPYFLKTEMDVNGGSNYTITGVTEFVSVPYALSVKTVANGANVGDMNYWNGTTWVPLNKGAQGQFLIFCDGKPTWANNGVCPDPIATLDCSTASHNGTLTAYTAASGITSVIPYTGGNGGTHNGQVVTSTGVTGLTATLAAGTFANGNGSLMYTITGTPSASGTASFTLNIGGKSCVINRSIVLPLGVLGTLDCANATNNGTLNATTTATGVTSVISYTGGNGGAHNGQVVASTGVTGLTATLQAGTFANGNGSLTYTITGTPATSGTASFALNIGGKMCTLTRTVAIAQTSGINFTSIGAPVGSFQNNVSDIDGNTYKTVQIGTQVWMAENLKTSKYSDGTTIPNITDNTQWLKNTTGAWAYYNNDAANNAKYGKLYNWYAVSKTTNGNKNVCPTGWHVPTGAEWTVLTDYLGGESVAGGKMKEVGLTSWNSPNTDAANTSLFTGLPGGYRYYNGGYDGVGRAGNWWSSAEYNATYAWFRGPNSDNGDAGRNYDLKIYGLSVRCLRD